LNVGALFLAEQDVETLLDMPTAIDAVETSFRESAAGHVDNIPRERAKAPGIVLHLMGAAAEYLGYTGWKCYTTTRAGARFLFGLYENSTGKLVALIEADRLGWLRTAATSAVAIKHLALDGITELGLFGSGWQARGQLTAAVLVRPIERAHVYSRNPERCQKFADEMSARLAIEVRCAVQPDLAVRSLPLIITATTSRTPVFDGSDLMPGVTVCAMGSNWLEKAEIDVTTIRRATRIVCDSIADCKHEAGDFVEAIQKGVFDYSHAGDLGDVIARKTRGRSSLDEIILFKSVGLAMEDVAIGVRAYELARTRNVGRVLPT
jgi:alanine dehydrogenase